MMLSKLRFSLPSFFFRSLVAESSVKVDDPFSCPDSEVPSFSELYSLPSIVIDNLREQGLVYPTEIQRKVLTVDVCCQPLTQERKVWCTEQICDSCSEQGCQQVVGVPDPPSGWLHDSVCV